MTCWRHRALLAKLTLLVVFLLPVLLCAKKKPPAHPVNLNAASSAELQLVPGIGPSTADKILEMRKSYGAFKSVDDLLAIKGIGPKRLEKMRRYLTVGKTPPKSPPAKTASAKPPAKSKTDADSSGKDDEEQ